MNQLFDGEIFENTFEGIRDKLIINMFYQTGMRVSELVEIKESDIDLINLSINVLGKRNKVRMIPITFEMKKQIQLYSDEKKNSIEQIKPDAKFFVRNDGNKINRKVVYDLVKEKLGKVTTGQKRSPHVLRHTFATQMLNNGAEINAVKEILGHASLAATQVYTHNTIEKLKNIYKQAHPKA
jgi:integrase/recombinase XerC